ncbi:MAG: nucleotidyltransferase family protein [Bacteroidia bacterium]
MLSSLEILQSLEKNKTKINPLGVSKVGLFGSYSKNTANAESDIDLYVEFKKESENFDNFINLCFLFDELFAGKKVDVVTKGSISKYLEPHILPTIKYAKLTD